MSVGDANRINTTSAKSRILDADVAKEQVESTRLQIIRQLATAQLAQANVGPQTDCRPFDSLSIRGGILRSRPGTTPTVERG